VVTPAGQPPKPQEPQAPPARRLILLRHAKSDWPDVPDAERPLAKRGRRDAPRIGRWLHHQGYQPDVVICSTALRTRQTWDLVGSELDRSPQVQFEPRAYAASALALRFLLQELPARYRTALLVAHNPGLAELAALLAQRPVSFPTAAVAVFELDAGWADLWPAQVRLAAAVTPGDL
jgi:phosphohistidine phosphatase